MVRTLRLRNPCLMEVSELFNCNTCFSVQLPSASTVATELFSTCEADAVFNCSDSAKKRLSFGEVLDFLIMKPYSQEFSPPQF